MSPKKPLASKTAKLSRPKEREICQEMPLATSQKPGSFFEQHVDNLMDLRGKTSDVRDRLASLNQKLFGLELAEDNKDLPVKEHLIGEIEDVFEDLEYDLRMIFCSIDQLETAI